MWFRETSLTWVILGLVLALAEGVHAQEGIVATPHTTGAEPSGVPALGPKPAHGRMELGTADRHVLIPNHSINA